MNGVPVVCDVCLVGGGHSHVLLIRRWAMRPLPGVRLTLVSSAVMTPYSGMLPGLIAGHYDVDDIHIDLRTLCAWAGIRFIEQTVTAVDLQARTITIDERPALAFDVLSLDTGSTPDLSVPGSREHVTPVKPVHNFHARWQSMLERLNQPESVAVSIGVVGSGAGGFELVSAMRHRLPEHLASLYWLLRDDQPLSGRPARVGRLARNAAQREGIRIVEDFDVTRVDAGTLIATDGRAMQLDEILWCTAASGPSWPAVAGLSVDERGFVATNAYLQSRSHEFVFATGDIGTQVDSPSAKAGVYAVRQAPYLYENIQRYVLGKPLKPYRPQKDFLSLMATGGKRAIASRGPLAVEADWVWRWKDHIDQTFMRQFKQLPPMPSNASLQRLPDALRDRYLKTGDTPLAATASLPSSQMRCRGCGSKVGEQVLERVLASLDAVTVAGDSPLSAASLSPAGDTAILTLKGSLVQSVDQINAIVDDPYLLGRIAALHAMSDVLTVDARPHSAQVIVTVPTGTTEVVERDLTQLMSGLLSALQEEQCVLVGGHTLEGEELAVGVVVNAELNSQSSRTQVPVTPGDALILTQPLGIGLLFAGLMQQKSSGQDISAALSKLLQSNRRAAESLRAAGASCMTDITGFGLLGHLGRLLRGLDCGAVVQSSRVPRLHGVDELAALGVRSSLWRENRKVLRQLTLDTSVSESLLAILCDPQTGGGLLAPVPAANAASCLSALHSAGYRAAVIGHLDDTAQLSVV